MKITELKLREMVRRNLKKLLGEGKDFSARRRILMAAQNASFDFEKEIISTLDLQDPDEMQPQLQQQYYAIVKQMEAELRKTIMAAVQQLAKFPKKDQQKKGIK